LGADQIKKYFGLVQYLQTFDGQQSEYKDFVCIKRAGNKHSNLIIAPAYAAL